MTVERVESRRVVFRAEMVHIQNIPRVSRLAVAEGNLLRV